MAAHGFSLDDPLDRGSFAEVFKGWGREGTPVAVKRISLSKLGKSNNRRLLEQEIAILEKLRHRNVVQLLAHEEAGEYIYLVMEFCNGGDLASYLQKHSTISEEEIRNFLHQLVDALNYLEQNSIVHRDLKPQNILLHVEEDEIILKLADFGFARTLFEEDMAATFCGSPLYMAPEVLEGEAYNALADLWSLGAIIYQCLTGSPPFRAPSIKALKLQLQQATRPPIPHTASPALADLLSGLLQVDPRARMNLQQLTQHPFLAGSNSLPPPITPLFHPTAAATAAAAAAEPDDLDDALLTPAAEVAAAAKDLEERSYVVVDPLFVDVNTLADSVERRLRLGAAAGGRDPQELVSILTRVTNPAGLIISIANGALISGGETVAGRAQARGEALVLFAKALALLRKGISNLRVMVGRTSLTKDLVNAVQLLRRQFNDCIAKMEEIRTEMTSTQMQSVRTSVSQLLYRHAVHLCRDAATAERRAAFEESARLYSKALVLLEVVLPEAHERDVSAIQTLLLSLEDRLRHARAQVAPRATAGTTTSGGTGRTPPQHHLHQPTSAGVAAPAHVAYSPAAALAISPPTAATLGHSPHHQHQHSLQHQQSQQQQQQQQQRPASRTSSRGQPHALAHGTPPEDFFAPSPRSTADSQRLTRTPSAKHSLSSMEAAAMLATSPPSMPSATMGSSPPSGGGGAGPHRSPSTRSFKASFCGNCGIPFSSEDQRFCMRCGFARAGTLEGDPTA